MKAASFLGARVSNTSNVLTLPRSTVCYEDVGVVLGTSSILLALATLARPLLLDSLLLSEPALSHAFFWILPCAFLCAFLTSVQLTLSALALSQCFIRGMATSGRAHL